MNCTKCSSPIKWVVAVDIDGTLAQYHRSYAEFVERYQNFLHYSLPRDWGGKGEFRDCLGLSKKDHHEMKLAFRAGGHKRWMPPFDLATTLMHSLEQLPNVEVWVTTTRPWMRMDNVDVDTVEWLDRNRIPFDHLLFDEDKYQRLTELVDPERIIAILDDEEEQRDRCRDLRLPLVLRRTEWNSEIRSFDTDPIENLMDFYKLVVERIGFRDALQQQ